MSDFVTKTFMSIEKKGINASVVWKTTHTHTEKGYNNSIRLGVNEAKTFLCQQEISEDCLTSLLRRVYASQPIIFNGGISYSIN